MIEDILLAADLESSEAGISLHPLDCDPAALLQRCAETVSPYALKSAVTVRVQAPSCGTIYADELRLSQVLDNLATNAIKYNRVGGLVDLMVFADDDSVSFQVSDDGIGVAPAELPGIFDSFSRASNAVASAASGSGLGLYIAQVIVSAHGGTITVTSELDVGTTFTVQLPRRTALDY